MIEINRNNGEDIVKEKAFDKKLVLGLVINKSFHEENKWCSATTYYLVEAIKKRFDCVYIENQSDYENKLSFLDLIISMEPGWAAPVLDFVRTNSLKQKLSEIPSYILYSDPHANLWREDYFLKNGLDYVLSYYDGPFKYHFKNIAPEQIIHFPWAIPDSWIDESSIMFHDDSKIYCYGGQKSEAYSLRNWCRTFPFVESTNNSGVENKIMTDVEYIKWLGKKDAAIAAGSDDRKYLLTVPKYFEIPAAGVLLFAQQTEDLGLLGFEHMKNCLIFDCSNFEKMANEYLNHPEDYINIRKAGQQLIRERHTVSKRLDMLEKHVEKVRNQKQNNLISSKGISLNSNPENKIVLNTFNIQSKILFIVDSPNWAHDFKTDNLIRNLGNSYEMVKCYKNNVTAKELDWADLIIVYYWKEFRDPNMQNLLEVFKENKQKLLVGICSHSEMEGDTRDQVIEFLRDIASGIFVNNMFLYKEYLPVFNVPVFYTPNGVDTKYFSSDGRNKTSQKLKVGWAGSLTNHLNVRGFDEYIVPAVESIDGVELVSAIREQKWRDKSQMLEFYRDLDIYICASKAEGTPNPCLEAAACGVPLVTTCVGNMPELIKNGVNGFIVERNVEDIAKKLLLLKDNEQLREQLRKSILETIKKWDWRNQAENYRIMFDTMLSQSRKGENSLFKSQSQLYLASADRMDKILDNVQALNQLSSRKIDTFATVIGGLSGLNYLTSIKPEIITFFDINPTAIQYAKLIVEIINISNNPRDFISRIFSRDVEQFLIQNRFHDLTYENQGAFIQYPIDQEIYNSTLNALSEQGKKSYDKFIRPYLSGKIFNDIRNCCRLLPCWKINERVPVGGGQKEGYDESGQLVPNTNAFYYGYGWLSSEQNFLRMKSALENAKLNYIHFDLLNNDPLCLGDFSDSIVLHASNIDDWFPEQWVDTVNSLVDSSLEKQGYLAVVTTNGGVLTPDIDPHTKAFVKIKPYVYGKVVEVTSKVPWGFHEFERSNILYEDYLVKDYQADTTILHILVGEGVNRDVFRKVYQKALANSRRVILLEHNKKSSDWQGKGSDNYLNIDSFKEVIEDINKEYDIIELCTENIAGETDTQRNFIYVVDTIHNKENKINTPDETINYFLNAQREFAKDNFSQAVQHINKYKSLMDYSKLEIDTKENAGNIDVSVVIVTYNRKDELIQCLETVSNQNTGNYEIIVVDNGGCDYGSIKQYVNQYIKCPINFNLSEGRNIGVHFAKGKIVSFLDDDALVEPDYISSIKSAFEKYDIFGMRGRTLPKNNVDYIVGTNIYDLGKNAFPTYCNQEGNSAWRRDIYQAIGGMDPILFGHEGSDLTYRVINRYNKRNKVIYWPETVIYHNYPTKERASTKYIIHKRSGDYLLFKHNVNIFINREEIEKIPISIKSAESKQAPLIQKNALVNQSGPKVSIVIACHNCEKYLSACIESILNQTMNGWELFLLDDASSDNTKNIIEKYAAMDRCVKPYYFQDNAGPYVRRNYAIEKAGSEFIVIQDSDDIMHPQKLEKLYNEITNNERLGIVGSSYLMTLDEFRDVSYCDRIELPVKHDEIMRNYKSNLYICWHGSAIIRKSLFEKIGLYDEHPYGSDKFWLAKAAEFSHFTNQIEFKNIPEYLTYKIEHSSSQQGQLPTLDPRSRRAKFQTYWLYKLIKIREKAIGNPGIDISSELRNCDCSDYIAKYSHLFEQWEKEKLDDNSLSIFTIKAVDQFNEDKFVSCIITLDSVEKINSEIAKQMKHYNLLRAMAYYAIDRKERSFQYIDLEIKTHDSPAAKQFLNDGFGQHQINSIQSWCENNNNKYDLRVIDINTYQNVPAREEVTKDCSDSNTNSIAMSQLPLVSVIIPAYNAAEYITDSINSVLNQDYKNFELIIINDGSTDNTEEIINNIEDNRIRYIYQNNQGASAAVNNGIKHSNGDFIIRLDSDDMMNSGYISKHIEYFTEHPEADLLYCDDYLIDENANPIRIIERPEYPNKNVLIRDLFRNGFPVIPFRTCIRRGVFDKIGLFDEKLIVAEDYDMIRRFVMHDLKACHLKGALYLRRITKDGLSRKSSTHKAKSHFDVVRRYAETFAHDELFPDMNWHSIGISQRRLHAKYLVAETFLSIGCDYIKAKSHPVYANEAFEHADKQLDECRKIDPNNKEIEKLAKQCALHKKSIEKQMLQYV